MPVTPPPAPRIRPSKLLGVIPRGQLARLADDLLSAGHSPAEVAIDIADVIDEAVDFASLVPGAVGSILESVDGPILRAVAGIIVAAAVKRGKA